MAREIKFNLWDKKQKLLLRTNTVSLKTHSNDDFILLQFTGMIDQNKTEIYEDDIIIYQHRDYTVVWEMLRGGWSLKDNNSTLIIPFDPQKAGFSLRMYNSNEIQKTQ